MIDLEFPLAHFSITLKMTLLLSLMYTVAHINHQPSHWTYWTLITLTFMIFVLCTGHTAGGYKE